MTTDHPDSAPDGAGEHHDVIVIGAGPAGEVVAGRLADRGVTVALVERSLVGGECSYFACIPSKALLRPGDVLAEARRVPGAIEAVTGAVDVAATLARRDELVGNLDDSGQLPWLAEHGVDLVRGDGKVVAERVVQVDDETWNASTAVVLATGSTAAVPDVLRDAVPWTNREVTTASIVPERLVIVGGGVVAVEMADAYTSLGSKVTVLVRDTLLLGREEDFVGRLVQAALVRKGVDVRFGVEVASAQRGPEGVTLTLSDGSPIAADEVLAAAGRVPNTSRLGLGELGVDLDHRGFVPTDPSMQVPGHPWLYAIGDVNGRNLLTHEGKYQGRVVADLITGQRTTPPPRLDAPPTRVVFTDPQVAAVGHTTASARSAGLDVVVHDVPLDSSAGSSYIGRGAGGQIRVLVDPSRQVVVGLTMVGPEVSEMLHAATIAITAAVPLSALADAVPAFPTRNEVWLAILEATRH